MDGTARPTIRCERSRSPSATEATGRRTRSSGAAASSA